ncbi:hypothetical protein AB0C47_13695 [Micromonospora taraxaci]|uniref:hypothetical protein n=1 Tax=Micromonospora taraxaci TaxID=1316803 RepID=UPI0033DEDD95
MTSPSGPSRRQVLAAAAAAATAPLIAAAPAQAAGPARSRTWDLTLLGTSDTHGNVYNWDYYRDAEYDDSKKNDIGVAKLATLINQIRRSGAARRRWCSTPATPSRALPWRRTTPSRNRSRPPGRSTRWPGR